MRRALVASLLLGLAAVAMAAAYPQHRAFLQRNLNVRGGGATVAPQFEFAMPSGAGLGTQCACADVTGTKGETITWNRDSAAYCQSDLTANALTSCATDKPRVMDGGVLLETAKTNYTIRSQAMTNAAWTGYSNCGSLVCLTADQAAAPDGTTTAERFTMAAQEGGLFQSNGCPASGTSAQASASVWIKGVSATGTMRLAINANGTYSCANCSYTNTSWTRCVRENVNTAAANNHILFGNLNAVCAIANTAFDVYIWQGQCEGGKFASSIIPTVAATVERSADSATATLASAIGPTFSMGANLAWVSTSAPRYTDGVYALQFGDTGGTDWVGFGYNNSTTVAYNLQDVIVFGTISNPLLWHRMVIYSDDSDFLNTVVTDGVSGDGTETVLEEGHTDITFTAFDGLISSVQIDPTLVQQ